MLFPSGTVGGCDIRGNSPGSRELAILESERTMPEVHAILLTGGSAFGLAAADGVMRFLEEKGIGYETPWARVPIVPAAVIFDLNVGSAAARPGAESGFLACRTAGEVVEEGSVGAGTGATIGKWGGISTRMKGGIGCAVQTRGDLCVAGLVVVNSVGDVLTGRGEVLAGARSQDGTWLVEHDPLRSLRPRTDAQTNTTLVVLMTNARLSKVDANRLAQRGHDGMARSIKPVHTLHDGDIVFAVSSGGVDVPFDILAEMGSDTTSEAIRSAVLHATPLGGVPALRNPAV
jgi:L-aminopeptidase/D-esterase-like protein